MLLAAAEDVSTTGFVGGATGGTGLSQSLSVLGVPLLLLLKRFWLGWDCFDFLLSLDFGGHNKWIL